MNGNQINIFELAVGINPFSLYTFIGTILISIFSILMIKLLRGSLKGWSNGSIDFYQLGSLGLRLVLIFNILIFVVAI